MDPFEQRLANSMKDAAERAAADQGATTSRRRLSYTRPLLAAAAVAIVLVATVVVTRNGAGDDPGKPSGTPRVPLTCPAQLAQASTESHGFGTREAASQAPDLAAPTHAIVCSYNPAPSLPGPQGNGMTTTWKLEGKEHAVTHGQMTSLASDLAALKPPPATYGCRGNLGPRFLLLYQAPSGTVGVVVDAYGCNQVRLTSNPTSVVAGSDPALGTGFLRGTHSLLQTLLHVSTDPSSLTGAELAVATDVARAEQAKHTGTFVGATVTAHEDSFKGGACPSGRTLHIRLVWGRDANFEHGGALGGPPDGPRKALILFADPTTGEVCRGGARYRDVGASPVETLLYGQWPDPKDS